MASQFGVNEGIAAAGAIGNFFAGRSAGKAQKELLRRQSQLANMQNQTYRQAQQFHQPLLQQYAQRAGIGLAPGTQMVGPNRYVMGSNWGTNEDQLRLQQAEEDINDYYRQQANQLRAGMGGRGFASGAQAAALSRLGSEQGQDFARFRRGLAINAGQEQERRLAQLQAAMGPGFGQGAQASAAYGQQAGMYGQQAASANAGLANIISQYQMLRMLQDQQGPGGSTGLGGVGGYRDTYEDPQLKLLRLAAERGEFG